MDPVTGLANRDRFTKRLEGLLPHVLARKDGALGLLHLSCDQVRQTRETLGPRATDNLLRQIAQRLGALLAGQPGLERLSADALDLARVGDQDFALLMPDLPHAENAADLAKQCLQVLAEPIEVEGHPIFLSPSIGIALAPNDGRHADSLLKSADMACSKAQASNGKTRYEFFSEEMTARSLERLTLTHQLRRALERDELRLHYQPKVCLRTGAIKGAEALVRWQHPEHGLLLPGRFITVAEESGLIGDIGAWVLDEACRQANIWRTQGLGQLKIAVNVARPQFEDGQLCSRLQHLLQSTGLPPSWLMMELTESMLVQDAAKALQQMHDLRALGVGLSIDDFGTGYSSLSYLKRFPASELKVDRSFIIDLPKHDKDRAIVQTVVTLGHSLGMDVVAEGIETPEQHRILQHIGCDVFQGFLFSKAVPPEQFEALVRLNLEQPLAV